MRLADEDLQKELRVSPFYSRCRNFDELGLGINEMTSSQYSRVSVNRPVFVHLWESCSRDKNKEEGTICRLQQGNPSLRYTTYTRQF